MENAPRLLIRTAAVAEMLHVSTKTVNRWCGEGKIPVAFRTIGGHRLYDPRAIAALAESLTGNGQVSA